MYFRVNLKMKKPTLCCCFTWIVFIELNFTVAFLLIRKTWDDGFASQVGEWRILRNGDDDFEMGWGGWGWYLLTDYDEKKKTFTNQGKLANNILSKIVIKRQHEKQSLFSVLHHQSIKFYHGAPTHAPPLPKISGLSCTNLSLLCFHVVESNTLLLNNSTIFNTGLF